MYRKLLVCTSSLLSSLLVVLWFDVDLIDSGANFFADALLYCSQLILRSIVVQCEVKLNWRRITLRGEGLFVVSRNKKSGRRSE